MGSVLLTSNESNKILNDENIDENLSSSRLSLFPMDNHASKWTPRGILKQSLDLSSWFVDDNNYIFRILFGVKTVRFADKITRHQYAKVSKRKWKKRYKKRFNDAEKEGKCSSPIHVVKVVYSASEPSMYV